MMGRPRLLPAVILGALGLFTLKAIGWLHDGGPATGRAVQIGETAAKPEVMGFAKFIANAHAPYVVPDPQTTGSVPDKKDKKDDKKEAAEKAKKEEEERRANDPRNKAKIINSGERPMSASEKALLERLGERREEIEARSKELEMREKLLETVEKKVEDRVGTLKELEDKLTGGGGAASNEAKGLKNLVIMYEAMKPKDAARIFDRLSIDVLLPVVQAMNPRKMSEILASMAPEAAEKLTVAIAARAGGAGREKTAAATGAGLPPNELPAIAPPPAKTPPAPRN